MVSTTIRSLLAWSLSVPVPAMPCAVRGYAFAVEVLPCTDDRRGLGHRFFATSLNPFTPLPSPRRTGENFSILADIGSTERDPNRLAAL